MDKCFPRRARAVPLGPADAPPVHEYATRFNAPRTKRADREPLKGAGAISLGWVCAVWEFPRWIIGS